jgi:hypothetical protein
MQRRNAFQLEEQQVQMDMLLAQEKAKLQEKAAESKREDLLKLAQDQAKLEMEKQQADIKRQQRETQKQQDQARADAANQEAQDLEDAQRVGREAIEAESQAHQKRLEMEELNQQRAVQANANAALLMAEREKEQTYFENGLKVLQMLKIAVEQDNAQTNAAAEEALCEEIMEMIGYDEGADLTAKEPQHLDTAFTYMCYKGLSKCVTQLLPYVKNLAVIDRYGETGLEMAVHFNTNRSQKPKGQQIVKMILKADQENEYTDINKVKVQRTPENRVDLSRPKLHEYIVSYHRSDFQLFQLRAENGRVVYDPNL